MFQPFGVEGDAVRGEGRVLAGRGAEAVCECSWSRDISRPD